VSLNVCCTKAHPFHHNVGHSLPLTILHVQQFQQQTTRHAYPEPCLVLFLDVSSTRSFTALHKQLVRYVCLDHLRVLGVFQYYFTGNGGQQRFVATSPAYSFCNDMPRHTNQHKMFSNSEENSSRTQDYCIRAERSTYEWSPSSINHSSLYIPTPLARSSSELYRDAQQFCHSWSESDTNSVDSIRSNSTQWSSDGLRVSPLSSPPPIMDNLLLTSSTNSPVYSVAAGPPLVQPTRVYDMSYISSPSLSPAMVPRDTSPQIAPSHSRRASVNGSAEGKKCSHCNATSTPLWRREPTTLKPLCNACGLYLQQRHRHRPKELIDADQDDDESEEEDQNYNGPECSHCHTHTTSVWRRSKSGAQVCNACGVYARLRGKDRPMSLKRKKIKPRTKHASISASMSPAVTRS